MRKLLNTILLLVVFQVAISQASLKVETLGDLQLSYPYVSFSFRAYDNNNPIILKAENLFILEHNYATRPSEITNPNYEGYQTAKWIISSVRLYLPRIFVIYNGELLELQISFPFAVPEKGLTIPYLKVVDSDRNIVRELRFGNVAVGNYTNKGGDVVAAATFKIDQNTEKPVRLDAVGTSSEDFKVLWLGSYFNTSQPPVDIVSPFPYSFEVIFQPTQNKYYCDELSFYYDGGRKTTVPLVGNSYSIPRRTQLQIIQPNGGEILYPCQKYKIEWKGHKPQVPVIIEYTTNKGTDWHEIAQVVGSEYFWDVPNIESDEVFVRVRQEYSTPGEEKINSEFLQTQKLCFSSDGRYIVSATADGFVFVFDLEEKQSQKFPFSQLKFPSQKAKIFSIKTFDSTRKAILLYKTTDYYEEVGSDSIAIVDIEKQIVIWKQHLSDEIQSKYAEILVDSENNRFFVTRLYSNKMHIHSLTNFHLIDSLVFYSPIIAFAENPQNKLIAFASLDNQIIVYLMPELVEVKRISTRNLPIVTNLAISNDARFVAFSTKAWDDDIYSNFSDVYVAEIENGTLVRSLFNNWSDAIGLGFSPVDNYLIIGFERNPILVFWDLVNDTKSNSVYTSAELISDFKISPTNFEIVTSESSNGRIILRDFNYPEIDLTDNPFKIHKPKAKIENITLNPQLIYSPKSYVFNNSFCSTGDVPLKIDRAYFLYGRNFYLNTDLAGQSIFPGECLEFEFTFNPIDTGNVVDTLVVESCENRFLLPFSGRGLNRNFVFYNNPIDFGQVCINDSKLLEIILGRNEDPVDLTFDTIVLRKSHSFRIISNNGKQFVPPQGEISITIEFQPKSKGLIVDTLEIFYLGQTRYQFKAILIGFGYGTEISTSLEDIRFIPEIPQRQISITNTGDIDITIDSIKFLVEGLHSANITTPFVLARNSAKLITIEWLDTQNTTENKMLIYGSPCAVTKEITLGPYIGTSFLWIDTIETQPKGIIEIPINYANWEQFPYNGQRFIEFSIFVNPRLFLPLEVKSELGNAELLLSTVNGNFREIKVRVGADFPIKGTLAKIIGNVGLGETDTSSLIFSQSSVFWSGIVKTETKDGLLRLVGLCGERRLFVADNSIKILSFAPNPVHNASTLTFQIPEPDQVTIHIFDNLGNRLVTTTYVANSNKNSINLDFSNLPEGFYRLVITYRGSTDNISFVKVNL